MKLEEFEINLDVFIEDYDFEELLILIKQELNKKDVKNFKFVGWFNKLKVFNIDGVNYTLTKISKKDYKFMETNATYIIGKDLPQKKLIYQKYNDILNGTI